MARSLIKDAAVVVVREDELNLNVPADKDASYSVRFIPSTVYGEIHERHVTKKWDKRTHQQVEQEQTAEEATANMDDLVDYCLVDWTGVEEDGRRVPCDREHKLKLPRPIRAALIEFAMSDGASRQERRRESFREPARVGDVLGRSGE